VGGEATENRQPRYRIRVALDQQSILAYGKVEHLLSGMAVEADLLLDRRTLLEWLLEPLLGARQRMKETGP
jgi:membrane fusion protein